MESKKINAKHVQKKVGSLFSNHDHHFLNRCIFGYDWESDFFSVTSSGYLYEVEVKISKADYQADFIKFKHKLFEGRDEKEVIKEAKYKYSKRWRRNVRMAPEKKIDPTKVKMPNRFFFACPESLIDIKEVPDYAGLIYVNDHTSWIVKNAPLLHKRKEDIKELLFGKYQWGYIKTKEKLEKLQKKHKTVSSRFETMCRSLEKEHGLKEGGVTSYSALKKLLKETK